MGGHRRGKEREGVFLRRREIIQRTNQRTHAREPACSGKLRGGSGSSKSVLVLLERNAFFKTIFGGVAYKKKIKGGGRKERIRILRGKRVSFFGKELGGYSRWAKQSN